MYRSVSIYDEDGNLIGYGIKADDSVKLQTTNLYLPIAENIALQAQLDLLNTNVALREVWPDARDPEVLELLAQENWEPVKLVPAEVVDEEHSNYVYNEDGIDHEATTIVTKIIRAPAEPTEVMMRTKKAQEVIARRRALRNLC